MKITMFLIFILISIPLNVFPQKITAYSNEVKVDLTLKPVKIDDEELNKEIASSGKYYALLMGVEEYQNPSLSDLDFPLRDVKELIEILTTRYTFEPENVTILKNPTRQDMVIALDNLSNILTDKDWLFIFYAGHGQYNDKTNQGFWLPSDANPENTSNWFRNSTLVDYLQAIPSRHTLLISDACFSGSIFKTRASFNNVSLAYYQLNKLKSRKAMTSGALSPVPDESVFLKYFKKTLLENENKFMSSEELFISFKIAVMNNSTTNPLFGVIQNVGDEGGDFVFIRRDD